MNHNDSEGFSSTDDICASTETATGDPCRRTPSKPDGKCHTHSEHGSSVSAWKFSPEFRKQFITLLQAGYYIQDAAEECDVTHESVSNWLNKGEQETTGPFAQFHRAFEEYRPDKSKCTRTKFTTDRVETILDGLREGCSLREAADTVGVDGSTLHLWIQKSRDDPSGTYGDFAKSVAKCYSHDLRLHGGVYPEYIDPDEIDATPPTRDYRGPNWYIQRRKALERDEYTCLHCGMDNDEHVAQWGGELHVHHITPRRCFDDYSDPEINTLSNLATLCHWCHGLFEGTHLSPVQLDNHDRRQHLRGRKRER